MRYIVADTRQITLLMLEAALKIVDPAYHFINTEVEDIGDLMLGDVLCAVIEINQPDEEIFEDDIAEFKTMVGDEDSPAAQQVRDTLDKAALIVAAEIFWKGTEAEAALERLDPLWDWLFAHYDGLLQADNEGFYNSDDLLLPRNFML